MELDLEWAYGPFQRRSWCRHFYWWSLTQQVREKRMTQNIKNIGLAIVFVGAMIFVGTYFADKIFGIRSYFMKGLIVGLIGLLCIIILNWIFKK
jgi:hypothetical protein